MALRSLIPVEDIRVAHVNSVDNSTTYESGVAYKAGTMVTYEGAAYVAATDIAEDDTDLPNAAPLKWGLVPNAFTSGGDDSGLATRVAALEETVGDETAGLVKDVDDLQLLTSGKLVQIGLGHTETYTPAESETWAVKIGKLRTQMQSILENIEDDERIRITEIILGNTVVQSNTASHLLTNGGSVYGDFAEINSNSSGYTVIRTVKVEVNDADNMYISTEINNTTSALVVVDKTTTSNTTSVGFRYEIYKLTS